MSLAILFHFLCAQHVSDINISIIRSLRLFCWITTLVVLFLVRCVLGVSVWLGWSGIRVASWRAVVLHLATRIPLQPNHTETKNNTTNVVIQQNSRKLLMMDILMSETCWTHKKWNKIVTSSWSFILQQCFRNFDHLLISEYYTRSCINTIWPPDDEHRVARNM